MSRFIKNLQKLKLQEGLESPADLSSQTTVRSTADTLEKEIDKKDWVKSFAIKFNAAAICLIIGIVIYHLGSLLSGQSNTGRMIKEQKKEIAALSAGIKDAQDRFILQEKKINALLAANKEMSRQLHSKINESNENVGRQLKKISLDSARAQTGIVELKQEYSGVKETLRQLSKKVETLGTPVVNQ